MIDTNSVKVRVKGEYACFTQPALKVERITYPCMTPSAARGVLECILWKPEFQWVVKSIKILKPIVFSSFKRNELNQLIFPTLGIELKEIVLYYVMLNTS